MAIIFVRNRSEACNRRLKSHVHASDIWKGMLLFSHVVTMGGTDLSVRVNEGSKGIFEAVTRSSTCNTTHTRTRQPDVPSRVQAARPSVRPLTYESETIYFTSPQTACALFHSGCGPVAMKNSFEFGMMQTCPRCSHKHNNL